jgi:hypothetical protein
LISKPAGKVETLTYSHSSFPVSRTMMTFDIRPSLRPRIGESLITTRSSAEQDAKVNVPRKLEQALTRAIRGHLTEWQSTKSDRRQCRHPNSDWISTHPRFARANDAACGIHELKRPGKPSRLKGSSEPSPLSRGEINVQPVSRVFTHPSLAMRGHAQ